MRHAAATLALACALAGALYPGVAGAAAWPRGEGNSFATLSWRFAIGEEDAAGYGTLYYEYGLSPRLTFGLDAGGDPASRATSAIAFLRHSFSAPGAADQFAWEIGAGWADDDGTRRAVLRPGLSWGRGWETAWGNGWTGIEATYAIRDDGPGLAKIDTTFGVSHPGGALSILQLQLAKRDDRDTELAIAPSHVIPLSDGLRLEMGGDYAFASETLSLKFGLWTEF
ncbi:hypothetical protein E0K89_002750 [Aquicoccus sp. SCR17]|nr:hypothetical protein [Carideicomes alvinocaridis]